MEVLKINETSNCVASEEQAWKDFQDRLSMPVKVILLDDNEKQALINKGLLTQSKENKTIISL